jgi:DNA repair protein SbcD/Mre11
MIRFVHTADIHFGMENYGKVDPQTGIHTRLLDFEQALNACITKAIEENVDFFLFCGDAYKTAHPTPTQQRLLFRCFLRLFEASIPLIIIVGNHDNPFSFGKAHALELFGQLPLDGFHVIAKPTILLLQTKNGPVNIVGIPWPSRTSLALNNAYALSSASQLTTYMSTALSSMIRDFADKLDPQLPAVLAGHLTVSSGIFSGSEKRAIYGTDPVLLPSQIALEPFDYVALGHLHRHQNLNPKGYPPIVYAGSIERVDFGERNENKGFCLVNLIHKGETSYTFIEGPMRPFIQVDVDLAGTQSHTNALIDALHKVKITDSIVKIVYHVPPGVKDRIDTTAVQQACAQAHHMIGMFPLRALDVRERRIKVTTSMSMEQLLSIYFASKPELADKKEHLIARIKELEAEMMNDTEQN